jgi:small subunit ribosomal protein S13
MIYVLNTDLRNNQRISNALCQIYGIGKQLSKQICDDLGIGTSLRIGQLTPAHVDMIGQLLPQAFTIGSDLQSEIRRRKERLVMISSYRGIRHSRGLPVRGQRTHGNAQTARRAQFHLPKPAQRGGKRPAVQRKWLSDQRGRSSL